MSFQLVHFSSCGMCHAINQDAYCIRICATPTGPLMMFAICDGMGGMNCGEIASSTVIKTMREWFDRLILRFPSDSLNPSLISAEWKKIIAEKHDLIRTYGKNNGLRLGTTFSAILLTQKQYYLTHIGDTRIYLSDMNGTEQLTKDQTLARRELEARHITEEEYRRDSRRNILLQCVGDGLVSPFFTFGDTPRSGGVILCSDGFYHTVQPWEYHLTLTFPGERNEMRRRLLNLANRARAEGERDDMTCVAFRWDDFTGDSDESITETSDNEYDFPPKYDDLADIYFINGSAL